MKVYVLSESEEYYDESTGYMAWGEWVSVSVTADKNKALQWDDGNKKPFVFIEDILAHYEDPEVFYRGGGNFGTRTMRRWEEVELSNK